MNHLRELEGVKSTKENLEAAISGETYEFKSMYPPMIEDAKSEGKKRALMSFNYANAVEQIHAELYKKAFENLGENPEMSYYFCQVCGNTGEMRLRKNVQSVVHLKKCLKKYNSNFYF